MRREIKTNLNSVRHRAQVYLDKDDLVPMHPGHVLNLTTLVMIAADWFESIEDSGVRKGSPADQFKQAYKEMIDEHQ